MWQEDYLEKKAAIISQYPDCKLIFNDVELFGDEERIKDVCKKFGSSAEILKKKHYPANIFSELVYFNKVLTLSTVLVDKETFLQSNWDSPYDRVFDWWILLHLARENEFYYMPEKLTRWRIHYQSYINRKLSYFTLPINFLAVWDIAKREKDIRLILFILLIILCNFRRIKVASIQILKKQFGIPLRCEKS